MNCAYLHLLAAFLLTAAAFLFIERNRRLKTQPLGLGILILSQTIPMYFLLRLTLDNQPCDWLAPLRVACTE
jgi:hypothetical protein